MLGRDLRFLESLIESESVEVKLGEFDKKPLQAALKVALEGGTTIENAIKVLQVAGGNEEQVKILNIIKSKSLAGLLFDGTLKLTWGEQSNLLEILGSTKIKIELSSHVVLKDGKIVEKTRYRSPQEFRLKHCETALEALLDLIAHQLCVSLLLPATKSRHVKQGIATTKKDFPVSPVAEEVKEIGGSKLKPNHSIGQIKEALREHSGLPELFSGLLNTEENYKYFFDKNCLTQDPTTRLYCQAKILEACLFYLQYYKKGDEKYKSLHKIFEKALKSYKLMFSTQSASSQTVSGERLSMSSSKRLGALNLMTEAMLPKPALERVVYKYSELRELLQLFSKLIKDTIQQQQAQAALSYATITALDGSSREASAPPPDYDQAINLTELKM